jgi:hypothetical protein
VAWCGLLPVVLLVGQPTIVEKRAVDRSLREYLFLDAQLGLRHRNILYAEDAADGPGARNELRVYVNGQAQSGFEGALAAYVGLGFVGRLTTDIAGDPIADPYDDFTLERNLRVFGAYGEWTHRDEQRRERYAVRAGRLSDWDARANLLVYDGIFGRAAIGDVVAISIFGGRRAILDGELPDDRRDALAQLVAGANVDGTFGDFSARLGYRLEEVHRALASIGWEDDAFGFDLSGELIAGGKEALETDVTVHGAESAGSVAGIIRLGGDGRTASGATSISGWIEAQLGRDPRTFGRGGIGPKPAELDATIGIPASAAVLDRLFFGPEQAHFSGELVFAQSIIPELAIDAGVFGRLPLGSDAKRSHQPALIEAWLGPSLHFASGIRTAVEARFAFEDPGDSERIFDARGDGLRRYSSLRLFAEIPIPIGELVLLSIRPEGEGFLYTSEGPTSRAQNQPGIAGDLLVALSISAFDLAARYGVSVLPDFGADGVGTIHEIEIWIGGTY